MLTFNKFFLALAFLGGSAAAQAAEGAAELMRVPDGKTSERIDRADHDALGTVGDAWSQGLSQRGNEHPHADRLYYSTNYNRVSGTHNGAPVAAQNLLGHYTLAPSRGSLFSNLATQQSGSAEVSLSLTASPRSWQPVHYLL